MPDLSPPYAASCVFTSRTCPLRLMTARRYFSRFLARGFRSIFLRSRVRPRFLRICRSALRLSSSPAVSAPSSSRRALSSSACCAAVRASASAVLRCRLALAAATASW
eukprot:scaffold142044_cov32-Tisochrysis_lutea.AAC.3